ncbi:MAG: hypothetical protein IKD42_05460 [Kiritimatiellae bacterium]|nr:hypothetical protein [Kiritimatiellia bacterium]
MNTVKKTAVLSVAVIVAATLFAQARQSATANRKKEDPRKIASIDVFPRIGRQAALQAPGGITANSNIGRVGSRPRRWIVLETKYSTYHRWQDQLTFTWHVLLDSKTATDRDKDDKIPPYSYFTASVTYQNIPRGQHAASVCLHPSNLERFGEPRAVGLVITKNGETVAFDCESQVQGIHSHPKDLSKAFWNDNGIMGKTTKSGEPLIERRMGLVDRSKTIWANVNPDDYEQTANN